MKANHRKIRMTVRLLLITIITMSAIMLAWGQPSEAYTGYLLADCDSPRLIANIDGSKSAVKREIIRDGWSYVTTERMDIGVTEHYKSKGGDVLMVVFDGEKTKGITVFVSCSSRSDAMSMVAKVNDQLAKAYEYESKSGQHYSSCSDYFLFAHCEYLRRSDGHFVGMMLLKVPYTTGP